MKAARCAIIVAVCLAMLGLSAAPQAAEALGAPSTVTMGANYGCTLVDGAAYCWGQNTYGQLGDGTNTDQGSPVAVLGGLTFTSISAGSFTACGLVSTGAAYCWGQNAAGGIGNGTSGTSYSTPTAVSGGLSFSMISVGANQTCGIAANVGYCWGQNNIGQVGDGTTMSRTLPTPVAGSHSFTQIHAGGATGSALSSTCAVATNGSAWCWGQNNFGQLGDGTTTNALSPVAVGGGGTYSAISTGSRSSCAIATPLKSLYCWGDNTYAEIGDGTTTARPNPTLVLGGHAYTSVTVSDLYSCGVVTTGKAYCFGYNGYGVLGDGTTSQRSTPVAVAGVSGNVSAVAPTSGANCVSNSVAVYCFGRTLSGRTGTGSNVSVNRPQQVSGGLNYTSLSIGSEHTCGVSTNTGYCWGPNPSYQLGSGNPAVLPSSPNPIAGGLSLESITTGQGATHSCALTTAGAAYCWSTSSTFGQLGDGTGAYRASPTAVAGGLTFSQLSVGSSHTCGVAVGGVAYCWGLNSSGQLGNGTTTNALSPVAVSGGLTVTSISAGGSSTCALAGSGTAFCWGNNTNGQLGDTTLTQRLAPVAVNGGLTFSSIASSGSHSCGISAGTAYCWGNNNDGQLGDNSTSAHPSPAAVSSSNNFVQLALGNSHTCGILTNGSLSCWGLNTSGQLGDGTFVRRLTPTDVATSSTFTSISAGSRSTCGIVSDGSGYCWGSDASGQLGANIPMLYMSPQQVRLIVGTATTAASVTINPSFTFIVGGRTGPCNGVGQTAGSGSSATSVSLGRVTSLTRATNAQDLSIATNSGGGFSVYVASPSAMGDGNGHYISAIASSNASPGAFPSIGTAGLGYTTSDTSLLTGVADRFTSGGAKWAGLSPSPAEVSANSLATSLDAVCVAFQVGVNPATPAGSYAATVVYSAVPSF